MWKQGVSQLLKPSGPNDNQSSLGRIASKPSLPSMDAVEGPKFVPAPKKYDPTKLFTDEKGNARHIYLERSLDMDLGRHDALCDSIKKAGGIIWRDPTSHFVKYIILHIDPIEDNRHEINGWDLSRLVFPAGEHQGQKTWYRDRIVRYFAEPDWKDPDDWEDAEVDTLVPGPIIRGKVVLDQGWIAACIREKKILGKEDNHGGFVVQASYPNQEIVRRSLRLSAAHAKRSVGTICFNPKRTVSKDMSVSNTTAAPLTTSPLKGPKHFNTVPIPPFNLKAKTTGTLKRKVPVDDSSLAKPNSSSPAADESLPEERVTKKATKLSVAKSTPKEPPAPKKKPLHPRISQLRFSEPPAKVPSPPVRTDVEPDAPVAPEVPVALVYKRKTLRNQMALDPPIALTRIPPPPPIIENVVEVNVKQEPDDLGIIFVEVVVHRSIIKD